MKNEKRKSPLRTFSSGRLRVSQRDPSPALFFAGCLFPRPASSTAPALTRDRYRRENGIGERRPCPEKGIPAIRCRELPLFPPFDTPQNVTAEKNAVPSLEVFTCRFPKTMPGTWHPGADRLLGTGSSEKRRATFQKKTPAELQKKDGGERTVFP